MPIRATVTSSGTTSLGTIAPLKCGNDGDLCLLIAVTNRYIGGSSGPSNDFSGSGATLLVPGMITGDGMAIWSFINDGIGTTITGSVSGVSPYDWLVACVAFEGAPVIRVTSGQSSVRNASYGGATPQYGDFLNTDGSGISQQAGLTIPSVSTDAVLSCIMGNNYNDLYTAGGGISRGDNIINAVYAGSLSRLNIALCVDSDIQSGYQTWLPNQYYFTGQLIRDPTDGIWQGSAGPTRAGAATPAAQTSGVEPDWTLPGPLTDGGITWYYCGKNAIGFTGTNAGEFKEVIVFVENGGVPSAPPSVSAVQATGYVGVPYSQTIGTSLLNGNVQFHLLPGSALPAGLSLDGSTGIISGTPTVSGTINFSVSVAYGSVDSDYSPTGPTSAFSAITYATALTIKMYTECFPAWLVINEPGTASPFTANSWVDQSNRLHMQLQCTFSWIIKQRGTAKVPLYIAAGDTYEPTIGSQVCLWDITATANFEVFSGTIDDSEVKWLGMNGDRTIELTCVSLEQVFDTIRLPPLLYLNQTAGFIFADLFAYATGSPVTLGTVDGGATIDNFLVSANPTIADTFDRLATLSEYIWGVDPASGSVYFTPPDTSPAPFTLDSEDVLWEQMSLKSERHDYRNRQILKVSDTAAVQSSELFAGSAQSTFTMLRPIKQITGAWLTQNVQNFAVGTFTGQPSPGDTISFRFPGSGSGYNWLPNQGYPTVGAIIIDSNGYIQAVTVPGTSQNPGPPAFSDIYGAYTTDNTVQWQCKGPAGFANGDVADYTFVNDINGYYGPSGVWPISPDNPTGQAPANAQFGLVVIGTTLARTIINLIDAINSAQPIGPTPTSGAGITFSLATWENPLVNADVPGGSSTFTVRNKAAGAGFIAAMTWTGSVFSFDAPQTHGGVTTFGTNAITYGVAGQTTGGSIFTIVYTPGSDIVTSATPLQPGNFLQIQYFSENAGDIAVENTALVLDRARIEGGTGKYQQTSSDDQALSMPQGLQLAQQQLAAFSVIPQTFEFTTFIPGLYVGQVLAISLTNPHNAPTLINGSWFIQEINAEMVPVYADPGQPPRYLPMAGHYQYTIRCIDVTQVASWIDFWLGLTGGGGSASGVAFPGGGALGAGGSSGGYSAAFTAVAATPLAITHALNSSNVMAAAYDGSGNLVAFGALTITDANTITITFGIGFTGKIVVTAA